MRQLGMRVLLGWVAMAAVVAGCTCGGPGPIESEFLVSFTAPVEGQTLKPADDVDAAAPGLQLNVAVAAQDSKGRATEVESASLEFRKAADTSFTAGPDATLEGANATFPKLTLEAGANVLRVTVKEKGSDRTAKATITVTVEQPSDTTPPEVTDISFQGDANGDHKLNLAEQATGSPVAVVTVSGLEDGQVVVVRDSSPFATVYGQAAATGGKATVTLSQLPAAPEADYSLVAEATDLAGNKNKVSGNPPLNDKAFTTLRVDRTAPTVTVTEPVKPLFGPNDDADSQTTGFQVKASVLTQADVRSATFVLTGGTGASETCSGNCIVNGAAVVYFTLPSAGTTQYTLQITAVDESGNAAASGAKSFTLDFEAPTLAVAAPASGSYTSFTQTVTVNVGGGDGLPVQVLTKSATKAEAVQGTFLASSGVASGAITFPGNDTYELIARATDAAGNRGEGRVTGVVIAAPGCPLALVRPSSNPAFLTRSDDADQFVADLQYVVRGTSAGCSNKTVTITKAGNLLAPPAATAANGDFSFSITLPSGPGQVLAIRIDDGLGTVTSLNLTVTVDLTTPVITAPQNNAVLNVSGDAQEQVAGVQRLFAYSPSAPAQGRADVCSSVALVSGATPCADGTSWFTLATNVQQSEPVFTFPDGAYQLKVVFVVGGATNVSAPITLTADGVRPLVTAISYQNDANTDRHLNIAELGASQPVAVVTTFGLESGQTVTLRDAQSGITYGSAQVGANGVANVTLNQNMTTTEADYSLVASTTDRAGNSNVTSNPTPANPLNSAAFATLRVDRVKPITSITAPSKLQLGVADDASASAGYQLAVGASTSSDVKGTGVVRFDLSGGAAQTASITPTGAGAATHLFTVPNSGTTTYTLAATATDESGNVGDPVSLSGIVVDNDVPTCAITSPAANTTYAQFAISTAVTVGGTNTQGLPVRVYSRVGAAAEQLVDTMTVSGGSAQKVVSYPSGVQTVRVEVVDLAGNSCTANVSGVDVQGTGCAVSVTFPTSNGYVNRSNDSNPATPATAEFTVTGSSSNCTSATVPTPVVRVFQTAPGSRTQLATGSLDAAGGFSVSVGLAEGVYSLEVEIGTNTNAATDVTVDLVPPTVGSVTPSGATLFFVASGNVNLRAPANPSYVQDGSPGGPADFNVTLTGIAGANGGTARVLYQGTVVAGPATISSAAVSIPVTLPHGTAGAFEVRVRDVAGNEIAPVVASATIDVIAPGTPSIAQVVAAGQERAAQVSLAWSPTYDDGTNSASGGNAGYDIRWTTDAVMGGNGLASAADYFDSAKARRESPVAWSSGNIARNLQLPPFAVYYISVRAMDDVGNYSDYVAPLALNNGMPQSGSVQDYSKCVGGDAGCTRYANPTSMGSFASNIASNGDLNGDGFPDVVVSAFSGTPGNVVVYYGGASLSAMPSQVIVPPDPVAQGFGYDISVGNIGDGQLLDGGFERLSDVLIGAPTYASARGRALVYFGRTATQLDTADGGFVEFRGAYGAERLGTSARVVNDINGDGLEELLLSAHRYDAGQGRVYVYYGRPKAQWIQDQVDCGGTISTSCVAHPPDRIIEGAGGASFGQRVGFASLGDVNGDSVADFSVPESFETRNSIHLFSGAVVRADGGSLPRSEALQSMSVAALDGGSFDGFGGSALGGKQLVGATGVDLAVSYAQRGYVGIYGDPVAAGYVSTPYRLDGWTATNLFGRTLGASDVNGDGRLDLILGEATGSGTDAWLWVFYNSGVAGAEFDQRAGTGFGQSRFYRPGSSGLGYGFAVGDLNQDGKTDLVVGDFREGTGAFYVWY